MSGHIRIEGIVRGTEVNGPGRRNMLHVQGCSLRCPGCFNPHTWDPSKGRTIPMEELVPELLLDDPDGVTISGGEPMEQPQAVYELLKRIRDIRPDCSTLMYTGYTRQRLDRSVWWSPLKEVLDVVVAGPYRQDLPVQDGGLVSSSNQELILLGRHTIREVLPPYRVEMIIQPDGTIIMTGFPTRELIRDMEAT